MSQIQLCDIEAKIRQWVKMDAELERLSIAMDEAENEDDQAALNIIVPQWAELDNELSKFEVGLNEYGRLALTQDDVHEWLQALDTERASAGRLETVVLTTDSPLTITADGGDPGISENEESTYLKNQGALPAPDVVSEAKHRLKLITPYPWVWDDLRVHDSEVQEVRPHDLYSIPLSTSSTMMSLLSHYDREIRLHKETALFIQDAPVIIEGLIAEINRLQAIAHNQLTKEE